MEFPRAARSHAVNPPASLVQSCLLGETSDRVKKGWKGNLNTITVINGGGSIGQEAGDAEGHGNPMIAAASDFCPSQTLATGNPQPVGKFLSFGAHSPKVLRNGSDSVAFLHTQLLCPSKNQPVLRLGAQNRQHR